MVRDGWNLINGGEVGGWVMRLGFKGGVGEESVYGGGVLGWVDDGRSKMICLSAGC